MTGCLMSKTGTDGIRTLNSRRIFDAHAHLSPGEDARIALLKEMDRNGIERSVVVAGAVASPDRLSRQLVLGGEVHDDADNAAVLAGSERSGGRLVPFFFANPHRPAAVYREHGRSFRGLKLAPSVHGLPFTDPRVISLVAVAAELGHGVYAHCSNRPGFGVGDYVALARGFPSVTFALGHAGVGDLDLYGIDLIGPQHNILFETSCGLTATVGIALNRLGADRLLFGSEYPLQAPRVELTKMECLDLTGSQWQAIAWDNAARFAGVAG
ncbi:amidohydrolase family protein [Streptomyces sp. XM4011]|uniref:amidohydrolase family protein n=1 Tax=Streptomyces sp. XM4011 TaxID=2929780 RepID=UPI0035B2741E